MDERELTRRGEGMWVEEIKGEVEIGEGVLKIHDEEEGEDRVEEQVGSCMVRSERG